LEVDNRQGKKALAGLVVESVTDAIATYYTGSRDAGIAATSLSATLAIAGKGALVGSVIPGAVQPLEPQPAAQRMLPN
jgi:hypothetical protein